MPAFEALTVVVVAVFVALMALMVIVTIGIHAEERKKTLLWARAPGPLAFIARRVLGQYVKKTEPEPACSDRPEQPDHWYERSL
jgi:hypothetical protein